MEITPHNVLDMQEDEQRREKEYQDAVMYANLAAQDDYKQQHGAGYDPSKPDGGYKKGPNGEWLHPDGTPVFRRGKKGEWLDKDGNLLYKKGAGGEWEDKDGKPLGRDFKPGEKPPGYVAGGYYDPSNFGSGGRRPSATKLAPTSQYGRDENVGWSKPAWMQMKLKSTGTGQSIRKGEYSKKYPKGAASTPAESKDDAEKPKDEADAPEEEQPEEGDSGKVVKRVRRKTVTKGKPKEGEGSDAAASEENEEYEEEVIEDEEEIIEEYEEEEIIEEEIIVEVDEDGNEIITDEGIEGSSTHNVTELQAALTKKANEMKLLDEVG